MADQNPQQNMVVTFADGVMQSGKYSNAVSVHVNMNEVVLDFGYAMPNTNPAQIQIVERVNLNHQTARSFMTVLQNAMLDFSNKMKEAEAKASASGGQAPQAGEMPKAA
jgi:hypothetical protein